MPTILPGYPCQFDWIVLYLVVLAVAAKRQYQEYVFIAPGDCLSKLD